jgi:hypothetical protein
VFSGARVAISVFLKMISSLQSWESCFFHCPWKPFYLSVAYTASSICTFDHLLDWHDARFKRKKGSKKKKQERERREGKREKEKGREGGRQRRRGREEGRKAEWDGGKKLF